ncbi:MAG: PEGA domain-containing protein [Candidatus Omnitrophica bacterium]|nr:PEGA domain-containing protein [Candidatus Omnitrophota bacterium]
MKRIIKSTQKTNIISGIICFLFLISLIGCATTSELICGPVETEILSDPDGAKIEIDNKYAGTTPLKVTLERDCDWYNYNKANRTITIKAEPINPKHFPQYKIIEKTDILPRRIIFYMYRQTSAPQK